MSRHGGGGELLILRGGGGGREGRGTRFDRCSMHALYTRRVRRAEAGGADAAVSSCLGEPNILG